MAPASRMNFIQDQQPRGEREERGARILRGTGWLASVSSQFSASFPGEEFDRYRSFTSVTGEVINAGARTRVVSFTRPSERGVETFVLKQYRRPELTGRRGSVARREYLNLRRCEELGVPAVEPAAYGERRLLPGVVLSSFLVTRFCDGGTDLRRWLRLRQSTLEADDADARRILSTLGALMRRLHERRFFLHTPNLRNILLLDEAERPGPNGREPDVSLRFLDLPFARTISSDVQATAAQARDIGAIFGPFLRQVDATITAPFYERYLPDPVAGSEAELRRRVNRAARIHNNATFFSGLRKRTHRRWMRLVRSLQR